MKTYSLLLSLLMFSLNAAAEDSSYSAMKDLFDRSQAPATVEEIKKFLEFKTECIGFNSNNNSVSHSLLVQNVLLQKGYGPAFPEKRIDAILLGASPGKSIEGHQYSQVLTKKGLELTTVKTTITTDCTDFGGSVGHVCSDDPTARQVKLNIKKLDNFITYQDLSSDIYGYCY